MKTTKQKAPKLDERNWKNKEGKGTDDYAYLNADSFTSTEKVDHKEMLNKIIEEKGEWFCGQPFVNLYVSNYGVPHPCSNTSLTIRKHVSQTGLDKIWDEYEMSELRKEMADGGKKKSDQILKTCTRCIEWENNGHVSTREQSNKAIKNVPVDQKEMERLVNHVKQSDDGKYNSVPNRINTIRIKTWGNFCNLKCLMCSPEDSSGVAQELMDIGEMSEDDILIRSEARAGVKMPWKPPLITYKDHYIDEEEFLRTVEKTSRIQLIGGETWLIKQNVQILEECIKRGWAKNITIFCFSNNFGHPNMQHIWDLLSQFKHVIYKCSMELWGWKNNYVRYPSNWEEVNEHIKLMNTLPNASLGINPTMNPINAGYAGDLVRGAMSLNANISFMYLNRPKWFTLKSLPDDIIDHHLTRLYSEPKIIRDQCQKVIDLLEKVDFDELKYHEMIASIKRRDKHRGDNILKYFPEWTSHFKGDEYYNV